MKKILIFVSLIFLINSCNKQDIDLKKPYSFLIVEAVQVLKKQLLETKSSRVNSEKKKIFDNSNINWNSYELETKNGIDMYYFNLYNETSIDTEKFDDKNKKKKPIEFDHFKRIAIKKNYNGTYTTYKLIYLPEKIDKTPKKNGIVKFSGKVLFLDINENFDFGFEYSNGKIVNNINKESGAKKGAKLNNCNYYQTFYINVYVYVYTVPNYANGDYHYSHTNGYEIWISCFNSTGVNTSSIFTGFGSSSGDGSGGFGPDGLVQSVHVGLPYDINKTVLVKSNECDAFSDTRSKSNIFNREYSGYILQGSNGPIYITLPAGLNTYSQSYTKSVYQNVSWGQGKIDYFEVVIDDTAGDLIVKLYGLQSAYATYKIIGHFHTHPQPPPGVISEPSTFDIAHALKFPNMKHEIWYHDGIKQYYANGSQTSTRNCIP